jgi:uncharacterized metal-binding protein YceD (DUF177 family)
MDKTGSTVLWSVPVAVEDIPDTGLHIEIEAPAATRIALAEFAALRELPRLAAVFDLIHEGEGVHVTGQVSAHVGQTCVVTLEPVESSIEEAVDLRFSPAATAPKLDEEPEPLVGGRVDLGAIATEFLLLSIDPYPRKADAKFIPPKREDDGAHPFAALETLKKRLGGGQS